MELDTKEYLDNVVDMLKKGAEAVPVPVKGSSMVPFLVEGDTVFLSLVGEKPLKRGDVVLYQREGGRYVLHRIQRAGSGVFDILGDAQTEIEYGVTAGQICARVIRVLHKGRVLTPADARWKFFSRIWLTLIPWRPVAVSVREKLRRKKNK